MTIAPALTAKAPGIMLVSGQKCGKKCGAGDLFSDVVGLEPTGDNEQVPPLSRPTTVYGQQAATTMYLWWR